MKFVVSCVALLIAAVLLLPPMPVCKLGDPGIYVGHVLMAGCPSQRR